MNRSIKKYIASLLLFGSNGIIASTIQMSSFEIVMFRTLIGSIFLISLYLLSGNTFHFYHYRFSLLFLLLSGASMGISWIFLYEAYRQIGVSIASLGYYCGPVIVMALSPALFKERFTRHMLVCFLAVLAGIIFVNAHALKENHSGFGIFCALMSAVLYAGMILFNKKASDIKGMENSVLQLTTSFLTVFLFVLLKHGLHVSLHQTDILPLIFLGLVNTGIGCFLYFSSIGSISVQTVSILGYLEPLSAVLFSFLFLREHMTVVQWLGVALILAGAISVELKPKTGTAAPALKNAL